ncbi:chemotaxis protein MotB [Desulfuromonas versatilis]|uniref:Chemotaxis protein MotB n=1 Tax=Desulfuromonas versatilis TaxID=2802975 RepID=A0ABM8HRE0_9BACT|nr:OmpA family protein [Desulfuromonas versatilis]BCR04505.1 chemotaxis protein MotB [Desulfuromonas versatilis]
MRPLSLLISLLAAAALVSGCVAKSTYQQKVDEATVLAGKLQNLQSDFAKLQEQAADLETRNRNLGLQVDELTERNTGLQQDLARARADIERLEKVLSARSAEAGAAMADMRQAIDRLEEQNRELANEVERERIAREARIAQMKSTYDELVNQMESEIQRGEITISELQGKLTVNMVERILFDSGKADIKSDGLKVLRRVGDILKNVQDKEIRVEGHTDNVPISSRLKETFPSNWELSTARATNVVRFLREQVAIPGERLSSCGYGEFRPVADNTTPEGRAQNRRIQIVLVPLESKPEAQ